MTMRSTTKQLAAHQRIYAALEAFSFIHGTDVVVGLLQSDSLEPSDGDVGREAQRLLRSLVAKVNLNRSDTD